MDGRSPSGAGKAAVAGRVLSRKAIGAEPRVGLSWKNQQWKVEEGQPFPVGTLIADSKACNLLLMDPWIHS
ncbi:hypothetical protein KSP39_PZI009459 [Platanthera zijinensis]|uniref:Uncharacterized protein n=1 Tax=Platanthera zijinensis TaxID=2320716 RepID=A0AAP0G884_9ASPA